MIPAQLDGALMTEQQLQIHITNDNTYVENGYTVYFNQGGACWIIDPGLPPQASQILEHVKANDLTPDAIVLTHAHADHIAGVDEVREAFDQLPVYLAKEEWKALSDPRPSFPRPIGLRRASTMTASGTGYSIWPRIIPLVGTHTAGHGLDITRLRIVLVAWQSHGDVLERSFAEDRDAVVGLLPMDREVVAAVLDLEPGKILVERFCFLEENDVRFSLAQPREQIR